MKTRLFIAILSMVMAHGAMASTPVEMVVPVDEVFVPNGFDSNDPSVEVVVTGYLPNLCHKAPSSQVSITGNKIDIKLTSLYYEQTNPFCPEMIVPFTHSVSLGLMDKGNYEVTINGKTPWRLKDSLHVEESTSNAIDDHNYAYVEYVERENQRENTVTLRGYNPSECFILDEIKHVSNGRNAYSVLPIMKQVSDFCPMKMVPFSYEWEVPSELKANKVLLHVRTMEGNSVNTIYNNIR